ncbi:HAMP domain-containing sensor histidine kinase [Actinocorallia sp. A-T 12471]|uniref:sensor histidine kinase n=1 Tax=Actinocorallia sp. A-T 12471 TaxID=3089813 RepID=UPI0029CBE183|nr:HAMP domain-containing sensor histidine kinase [Actinocorallia sp. A-T 12471]MDX6741422.1 HAMP domain-containing sensor histidine kinase [Actinocorallia sp. A-T 12471]
MNTWSMNAWSIRTRLTVIATAVMAVLCVVASALLTLVNHGQAVTYRVEEAQAVALKTVHLIKRADLPRVIPPNVSDGGALQVIDAKGVVAAGTGNLAAKPRQSPLIPPDDDTTGTGVTCDLPDIPGCKIIVVFRVYEPDGDWYVYSFDDVVPWYISDGFLGQLVAGSLLLLAFTAIGTALVVGRALRPVEHIRRAAKEIGASVAGGRSFGSRILLPAHHDELRALAVTANEMIDRLEASLVREREFTSNTSHDLRTPVTAMRAELDGALLHPGDTDWPATAERLNESVDRLQAIIEDLLVLSRLDSGAVGEKERLDLSRLVRDEVARRKDDDRIEVEADAVYVEGSRLHLARLFTNLLDNAVRHAAERVVIRVYAEPPCAVLEVENDGDTIPPAMREAVFERFTRLDASRTKDTGGSGLGLAIVREIAHAHQGSASVADIPTGTCMEIRLPLA